MDTSRTAYRTDLGHPALPLAGREVVVGYDASSTSAAAVRWAAAEAARLGSPLTVMYAADFPIATGWTPVMPVVPADLEGVAAEVVAQGKALALEVAPDLVVRTRGVFGRPAAELVSHSSDAGLLVVGRRHRSEGAAAVLGSVSFAVILHARCPVVVVQVGAERRPAEPGLPVVVGVDGSAASMAAMGVAAQLADDWGAELHLVSAWGVPAGEAWSEAMASTAGTDLMTATEQTVRRDLDTAAEAVRAAHPDVPVTVEAVDGDATLTLLSRSERAAVTVVGSRGHGGFAGMMLGSVSHAVLREGHSPVVVVRRGNV